MRNLPPANIHCDDPQERVAALIRLLDVEPLGDGRFVGARKLGGVGRVYGGQVIGQALAAASKTVHDGKSAHSLHAYFLRGGSEDHEIEYRVDADFDGRSFSNRRVVAMQEGEVIFNLAASFHGVEEGYHHQDKLPEVPDPETLKSIGEYLSREESLSAHAEERRFLSRPNPMDVRPVGVPPMMAREPSDGPLASWFRAAGAISHQQWMHRAILAYMSDFGLIGAAIHRHGGGYGQRASLDHSLWFHADVAADEWLLYHMDSPWTGAGRGLAFGQFFSQEGTLVASAAQEGLMRPRRPA